MPFVEIVMIAVGLAMDAAAVSLAVACGGYVANRRAIFRLSFHFGLFQFMMPIIGWYLGNRFVSVISGFGPWVAFGVLIFLGAGMIRTGAGEGPVVKERDPSRGWDLIALSIATSIDALAIGLSLAFLNVTIWYPALVIGVVTVLMSVLAIISGCYLGMMFGKKMEILGGLVLIGAGIKVLLTHM